MITVKENIPLAPLTTFKIGGAADYYAEVKSAKEITEALGFASKNNLTSFILSGGSNVLFPDSGFKGLVIHLTGETIEIRGNVVHASTGSVLGNVIHRALEKGLGGMERMSGIPGSLGGAVRGNAGAFGVEIKDFVTKVKAVSRTTNLVKEFSKEECQFEYRNSFFKKNPEWVILEVTVTLIADQNPTELLAIAKETRDKREAKHPQSAKCAGSFFMNPVVNNEKLLQEFAEETGTPSKNGKLPAGWLINHVGLKGKQIGGAKISKQHPNYLVNTGNATAQDVIMLASIVKTKVRDELGVRLREEVQFVGF